MRTPEQYISYASPHGKHKLQENCDIPTYRNVGFPESCLLLGSTEKTSKLETHGITVCHTLGIGAFNEHGDPALYLSHEPPHKALITVKRARNAVGIMIDRGFNRLEMASLFVPDLDDPYMSGRRFRLAKQMIVEISGLVEDTFDVIPTGDTYSLKDRQIIKNGGLSYGLEYSSAERSINRVIY